MGDRTLIFSSGALTPAESSPISITTGPAATIEIQDGDDQTAGVGEAVTTPPSVIVRDGGGNPVSGVEVDFVVTGGDGLVDPPTVTTGANGIAAVNSWTLGPSEGANSLEASASVGEAVTFTATGSAAATTTDLSAVPTSGSVQEEEVTFTANVTSSGGGTPTGQVSFRDDGAEIARDDLEDGVAEFATTSLTAETHTITAHYLGDGAFSPSDSEPLSYDVAAANVAPTAQPDEFNGNEDASLTVAADGVLDNDGDAEGDDLTAQLVSGPANAQNFLLEPSGSFTYTPEPDFNGNDSFIYQANDGQASSNVATVTITVNPMNDAPEFTAGGNVSTSSLLTSVLGESHAGWASGISPGPPDESSQTVEFEVSIDNAEPFQTFLPQIDAAGNLTYQPDLRSDTIVVNASVVALDSGGATGDSQPFTITITP